MYNGAYLQILVSPARTTEALMYTPYVWTQQPTPEVRNHFLDTTTRIFCSRIVLRGHDTVFNLAVKPSVPESQVEVIDKVGRTATTNDKQRPNANGQVAKSCNHDEALVKVDSTPYSTQCHNHLEQEE